jgi:hypothetical protein
MSWFTFLQTDRWVTITEKERETRRGAYYLKRGVLTSGLDEALDSLAIAHLQAHSLVHTEARVFSRSYIGD